MARYNEAVKLIESGKTAEARVILDEVKDFPEETGLQDNAEYWIAVSYFDEGNFELAIKHYRVAQSLPDGNKAAAAQYELALANALNGDTAFAVVEYYKVAALYPNSGLTERAEKAVSELGGPAKANIPDYGPATPSIPGGGTKTTPKPTVPLGGEKASAAPLEPAGEPAPVIAKDGPLAGAEIPVPIERKQPQAMPLDASGSPKPLESGQQVENAQELPPAETAKPPDSTAQDSTKATPKPVKAIDLDQDSAPISEDPRNLIKPDEKNGM